MNMKWQNGFGDIYKLESLEVHGSSFQAQIVGVSDSMNENPFDSGVFGVLNLCGWCQSAFDFCARLQLRERPHGYSPPHTHPLHDTDLGSLISYEPVEIVFSSDTPIDPASIQSVLKTARYYSFQDFKLQKDNRGILLHVLFSVRIYRLPCQHLSTYWPRKRSVEPDQSPEAATAGWDLQTIGILR